MAASLTTAPEPSPGGKAKKLDEKTARTAMDAIVLGLGREPDAWQKTYLELLDSVPPKSALKYKDKRCVRRR